MASLTILPNELIRGIFSNLAAFELATDQRVCRRWKRIGSEALLWRRLCMADYRFWDEESAIKEKLQQTASTVDWDAIYAGRVRLDRRVDEQLELIIAQSRGRMRGVEDLAELGYNTKDRLLRHADAALHTEDYLARRYWTRQVLGRLHRGRALDQWLQQRVAGKVDKPEQALLPFDLFMPEIGPTDIELVGLEIDDITTAFTTSYTNHENSSTLSRAFELAKFLRKRNLVGLRTPSAPYYRLHNNLLSHAIALPGHSSLPLVSAVIFCAVAVRIGLSAYPCNYPRHVYVVVNAPAGYDVHGRIRTTEGGGPITSSEGSRIFMDPFSSSEPVDESLLRRQLHSFQYQVTKELEDASLEPMDFKEMILRTARNVRFSVEWHVTQLSTDVDPFFAVRTPFEPARDQLRGDPSLELTYTEYAAIWASVLMNSDRRREPLHTLCGVIDARFPMDSKLLEREVRSRDEHMYALEPILAAMKMKQDRDLMAQVPKRRSTAGTGEQVPFRIGQLIRHRRYEYQGVIYGWDTACEMNEAWQARMHIHDLPGGSQQSFYQVLSDDRTTRYVAECNIEPLDVPWPAMSLMQCAGKYFRRWDPERRLFVSNIREQYPDD